MKFEKEFNEAHPEMIGEKDRAFYESNYMDWLEDQYITANSLESSSRQQVKTSVKSHSSEVIQAVVDTITDEDRQRSREKLSALKTEQPTGETVFAKRIISEYGYPKEFGTYLTDIGIRNFHLEEGGVYHPTSKISKTGKTKFPKYWLEEIPLPTQSAKSGESIYIQKTRKIEARKFTNENKDEIYNWALSIQQNIYHGTDGNNNSIIKIPDAEGRTSVCCIGDYIIKYPNPKDCVKLYSCNGHDFEKTWEPITAESRLSKLNLSKEDIIEEIVEWMDANLSILSKLGASEEVIKELLSVRSYIVSITTTDKERKIN